MPESLPLVFQNGDRNMERKHVVVREAPCGELQRQECSKDENGGRNKKFWARQLLCREIDD